jgi:Fe-S-cluster containining protein
MQRALRGEGGSDVACDGCTACCTSFQFVHIGPEETDTLAQIPTELTFSAPGWPAGHVVLGYDANGHCPMLVDGACSIYAHRPRTCRTYDCRVFPAAGVEVDERQAAIGRRARRWEFAFPADADRVRHEAVQAAAVFVQERGEALGDGFGSTTATQRAVLAVRAHEAFLVDEDAAGGGIRLRPELEAEAVVAQLRAGRAPHGGLD